MTLRLGSRGSALALAQARPIAQQLGAELVVITSDGDRSKGSLAAIGGSGVFAVALRRALHAGEVDVVVHSYKDLPTEPDQGLIVAAVPERADPRDALCSRDGLSLEQLRPGARVGTGSPRRRAQLLAARADLEVVDIRGNVDTRLARVTGSADGPDALDAIVLAAAGLDRLGRQDAVTHRFPVQQWPPAPAQGALAVEVRAGEQGIAQRLDHLPSRISAEAERAVLAILEAGCAAPIGAHAAVADGVVSLLARVYRPDGSESVAASGTLPMGILATGTDAGHRLAAQVAGELLARGAAQFAPLTGPAGGRA